MMVFSRIATCLIWFTATDLTSGFKSRFQTDSRVFFAVQLNCNPFNFFIFLPSTLLASNHDFKVMHESFSLYNLTVFKRIKFCTARDNDE
ncbi:hypothetical protein DEO72_LG5g1098 [Vigna unguiculata]|uniref:Secreted protein n=1 Tax=Vigna unguiculata TaxID=3917 RepID=A0A4D6LWG7_VIGUN|nr:hypothetical protein DEO72_LG5g1098 [Vigna unguiculata]